MGRGGGVENTDLLEPGDRFEVIGLGPADRLELPAAFGADGIEVERVEDAAGKMLGARPEPGGRVLRVPGVEGLAGGPGSVLWLEYQAPGRFRLVHEGPPPPPGDGELVTEQGVRIVPDPQDWSVLHAAAGVAVDLEEFDLALEAARLATHAGFDRLIALPMVREIEILEQQVRTAKTVVRRFRGRAQLCDEVGLGKTIEAGLILSELMVRGLVRSVLVLTPPSLIEQWQGEMPRKLSVDLVSHDARAFSPSQ
jgi:hypothetical protein